MPSLTQRWNGYQPTKEQTFFIVVAAIIATLSAGFGPGGWVTGGSARKMAEEAAQKSRVELAAAVCAEAFMRAADARARLAKLKKIEWYERDDLVAAGGWATMPGENEASGAVAELCASRLADKPAAAASPTPIASVVRPKIAQRSSTRLSQL